MRYFERNKGLTFKELEEKQEYREAIEKEGIEFNNLLEILKNRDFKALKLTLSNDINEKNEIMEPLLYSVKEEYGTYEIYKCYGEKLQRNRDLVTEIISEEPNIFENTPVSNDQQFILEMAEVAPNIVLHMSPLLKENTEFTKELCELNNKEITINVAKECKMPETIINTPDLAENKIFMSEIITDNPQALEYVSENLKNDYDFMKEVAKSKETIDYVVKNIEDFGENGLSATKDALVEISSDEAISGFEEEQEKVKKQIEEKMNDNGDTQLDGNNVELEELLRRDKQLKRHARFFERIKNGEIDPVRAAKLMDKICVNLDANYREEIKKLLKLDEAILEKQKESKDKEDPTKQEEIIDSSKVEEITGNASFVGIEEETEGIREGITFDRNNLETRNDNVGEITNEDDSARA